MFENFKVFPIVSMKSLRSSYPYVSIMVLFEISDSAHRETIVYSNILKTDKPLSTSREG